MSQWVVWMLLSLITGRPLLSLLILIVFWYGVDRVTFRFLPSPVRWFNRWRRLNRLHRNLLMNPHDRRARLEIAELYVERGRYREAVETLKPNLDAGDDDASTLFAMGVACLGAGYPEQGEKILDALAADDPKFRLGAVDLERGRWRLKRGDARGAREALERFVDVRKGSVEGRVLLASALALGKDDAAAALMREAAWKEYVGAPRFQRNMERFWAWRAKPSRPAMYGACALVLVLLFARYVAPALAESVTPPAYDTYDSTYTQQDEE
jgi:tetratricopeptide (TPR) repeat protein